MNDADVEQLRLVVVIDSRERQLIDELSSRKETGDDDSIAEHLVVKPLDLGDVQFRIVFPDRNEEEDDVVFERKTLADLGASIKDGRYAEQKARLLSCRRAFCSATPTPIVYILENCSSFSELQRAALISGLHPAALQSAVYNLMFRHGILVMTTSDVRDTAAFVEAVWRRRRTHLFSADKPDGGIGGTEAALLAASTASKRNKNVTRDTCYLMQLCQVPGVSGKTAKHIAGAWPSMAALYRALSGETPEERVRRLTAVPTLGKKSAENISAFLFCD